MPRQPRPDSRRRASASRTKAPRERVATPEPVRTKLPSSALTTRAAVLGLVLCGLVVSAALPLRETLDQRSQIADTRVALAEQQKRVDELETTRKLLDDPSYIKSLAAQRLHYVVPGEHVYGLITPPTPSAAPVVDGAVKPLGDEAPWYSQLYGTVQSADKSSK